MLTLWVALISLNLQPNIQEDFQAHFESSEHAIAGDQVNLFLGPGQTVSKGQALHLPNGLALSFGDLIAMGDFYGVVGSPISLGSTSKERRKRFQAAFESLSREPSSASEASKIIAVIHEKIATGNNSSADNVTWNCLTGGACSGSLWFLTPGRYLELAKQDYDHFGENALRAYTAGHELALQKALEAGKSQNWLGLEQAYAMDAFANHFLTDCFSSGHLRVPRMELPDHVTPAVVGSLLGMYMHHEESAHGLHVHNQRGDHWIAYGDGHYLDQANRDNRAIMHQALQLSADQIYEAFFNGKAPENYSQLALIPIPDEQGPHGKLDISPMFYFDKSSQKLMRREDLSDPSDRHWTSVWMGWSTLAYLKATLGVQKLQP
jgi:hypothetical protein